MTTRSFASILRALGAALVLTTAGCASSTAIRTGGVAYAPLPSDAPVAVYFDERSIGRPFEIVGEVEVDNPGKYQVLTVQDAVPALSARARSLGADAIIIDASTPVKSGIISTGIYARARAVRLLDAPVARAEGAPQDR
ncbi:MAG TPA: hypothetical protein VGG39_05765 [Polyangiaceae bacterium]